MNFSAHQKQMNLLESSQSPIHSPGGSFLSRQRTTSSTNQDFNNANTNNNNSSGSHFFEDISSMMRGFGKLIMKTTIFILYAFVIRFQHQHSTELVEPTITKMIFGSNNLNQSLTM